MSKEWLHRDFIGEANRYIVRCLFESYRYTNSKWRKHNK